MRLVGVITDIGIKKIVVLYEIMQHGLKLSDSKINVILERMMLRRALKSRPTKHFVLMLPFIIVSIFCPVVFVPAEAYKVTIFPIFKKTFPEFNEMVPGIKTNIDQMILSQKDKTVTKETSKSKRQNLPKKQMVTLAKEDLSERLSLEIDQIKLLEVREVTWPNSSFGCPQPGKVYTQAVLNGLLIRLETGGRMYFYHSAGNLNPFLCKQTSQIVPHPSKIDEFIPPPGSEID